MNSSPKTLKKSVLCSSIGLVVSSLMNSAFAITPPDAGQALQQLQTLPAPTASKTPAPILNNNTNTELSQGSSSDNTPIHVTQIQYRGNTVIDNATLSRIAGKLDHDLALNDLRAITHRISRYYRDHGYLLARAYLPAQDINSGTVIINILEGRLDQIHVNNQSKLSTHLIEGVLHNQQAISQPVRSNDTNRALLILQNMPGVGTVQGGLSPSSQMGGTELNVDVTSGPLATGYVGLDNYGNRYSGGGRITGGVNLNNLTGFGDLLTAQSVVTTQDQLDYGRLTWDAPVGHDGLRLGAAFSNVNYTLKERFASLDAYGIARTGAIYGSYPILTAPDTHINANLSLERRKLVDITSSVSQENSRGANAAVLTLSGDFRDRLLLTPAVNAWRMSITKGDLTLHTPNVAAQDASTAQTAGSYDKVVASFSREQLLPANFSFYLTATGQRSNKNLDSSEQFSLGGTNGVRAYPEGEGVGDEGWTGTTELRYNLTSKVQLIAFYDIGSVKINKTPYISQPNGIHLSAEGIGANTRFGPFSLKTSIAWHGNSPDPVSDSDRTPRIWAQGMYTF